MIFRINSKIGFNRLTILLVSTYFVGGRNGNPLQYLCLENPMDRGAWRATTHGVTKSRTLLKRFSTHACTYIVQSITVSLFFRVTWNIGSMHDTSKWLTLRSWGLQETKMGNMWKPRNYHLLQDSLSSFRSSSVVFQHANVLLPKDPELGYDSTMTAASK